MGMRISIAARLLTAGALGLLMAGCDTRIPPVTPALVVAARQRDADADQAGLEHGRLLYVNRCDSCHTLNEPRAYGSDEWRHWMRKMAPKARLDAGQQQEVLAFVLAARDLSVAP